MTEVDSRPVPLPDEISAFFWEGASDGRLLVQRCRACTRYQYPPDVACVHCQSPDIVPEQVSGLGRVWSYTLVDRVFHAGFANVVPYVVALVELDEQPGLRLLTNIVEGDPSLLSVGAAVEVCFEVRGAAVVPQFRPVVPAR